MRVSELRRTIARRLNFKYAPFLQFRRSTHEEKEEELDSLFARVRADPAYVRYLQDAGIQTAPQVKKKDSL